MKNSVLFISGVLLGFIPVYTNLGWILVFAQNPEASHIEKQAIYFEKIMFGISSFDSMQFHLITTFFGFISVYIFSILLRRVNKVANKKVSDKVYFILYLTLLILISFFTFMNIWGIL